MENPTTRNFESLVSSVVLDGLYLHNPFRLLELPVDCSEQEISKRQRMIEIASNKKLQIPEGSCRMLPVTDKKDVFSYSEAAQQLLDPEKRFIDEYFWFWPEKFGDGVKDESLQALKSGEIDAAIDLWANKGTHISIHNLAIYSHLMALENEDFYLDKTPSPTRAKKMTTYWRQAYKRWEKLLLDEQHWKYLKEHVYDFADPRLTADTADQMRNLLPYLLLLINLNFVTQAIEKNLDPETIARHKQIIDSAEFEPIHHERAIQKSLEPIQQRAKTFISYAKAQADSDPVHANKAASDLIESTKPLLKIVQNLLPDNSHVSQAFHDDLISCVNDCITVYAGRTENWGEGHRILNEVAGLARSASMREKIDSNLKALSERAKAGSDWCAEGYFDAPKPILDQLELAREKFRVNEHDYAVQMLESLLPTVETEYRYLVAKPLAFCLNIRSIRRYEAGLARFQTRRKILDKIATRRFLPDFTQMATVVATGQQQTYARMGTLHCMACGAVVYSQWAEFTYENSRYLICMSCNTQDQVEQSARMSEFAPILTTAITELTRAKQLDPSNSNIPKNLEIISGVQRDLMVVSTPPKPAYIPTSPSTPRPTYAPASSPNRKRQSLRTFLGRPAAIGYHLVTWAIDSTLLLLITFWLFGKMESIFIPLILYYWIFQILFHCTIGEAILKTRVVVPGTNSIMNGWLALWRAIVYCGMVFVLFYFWWGGALFLLLLFNKDRRGLQDFLSGTKLIHI